MSQPMVKGRQRIGRQQVEGIDAGKALRILRHAVGHVSVVVTIGRRGMHDRGFRNAGLIHLRDHLLDCDRTRS
jgi:hypothetical protein